MGDLFVGFFQVTLTRMDYVLSVTLTLYQLRKQENNVLYIIQLG